MVFLILESLGSTELVFILIMALVFFGPRKLPQISRSLGKNLADFRRASEDFKRTWNREVNLEESGGNTANLFELSDQNSILKNETGQPAQISMTAVAPDEAIARHSPDSNTTPASDLNHSDGVADETKHSPKSEWL